MRKDIIKNFEAIEKMTSAELESLIKALMMSEMKSYEDSVESLYEKAEKAYQEYLRIDYARMFGEEIVTAFEEA